MKIWRELKINTQCHLITFGIRNQKRVKICIALTLKCETYFLTR